MTEKRKEKSPAEIGGDLEILARFLDLHLSESKTAQEPVSTQRWPVLKALVFIFGTSLLIWALVIALVRYLI